jgi:hypothetical protein
VGGEVKPTLARGGAVPGWAWIQRSGRRSVVLAAALLLSAVVLLSPGLGLVGADEAATTVFVRYRIDHSQVPSWVSRQDLTLRIRVGAAQSVWAWGDGRPLPVRLDPRAGTATVTTTAAELLLAARGEGLSPASVGDYALATLKDDKLWAYSLTFDDGKLSVYQFAYPELRRYDYRAGVAVIGWWLDRDDALANGYCRVDELQALMDAGWGMFNHGYSHYATDINLGNAQRCQEAMRTHLQGHEATVFTVPHTDPVTVDPQWVSIIDGNTALLGLRAMQLSQGWEGNPFVVVDPPIWLSEATYKMGRLDITRRAPQGYFDDAHARATGRIPAHTWVSLHGHDPNPMPQDPQATPTEWCALAESTSYLYHAYGAGGTNEVWVAPADEVFEYLVVRSYARVSRSDALPRDLGPAVGSDRLVSYQQGVGGYSGMSDTYIQEWFPGANAEREANLQLRGASGQRETILLKATLVPPEGATAVWATLSLYATNRSNEASISLNVYQLLQRWVPAEATWQSRFRGQNWGAPGARAATVDRSAQALDAARVVGKCAQTVRWYAFDVTEAVRYWLAHPDENHGLLIEGPDEVSMQVRFASSEYYLAGLRPVLRVLYRWPLPEPTPTPTTTSTPTPEPTSTPTPQPGWVRGDVWEDANRNGVWDAAEKPLAGVSVELHDAAQLIGTRTTGQTGGFTFAELAPGAYTVIEEDLPGFTSTTSNTLTVQVYAGQESKVAFGDCRTAPPARVVYLPLALE